jgi:hypothetical protein
MRAFITYGLLLAVSAYVSHMIGIVECSFINNLDNINFNYVSYFILTVKMVNLKIFCTEYTGAEK